MNYVYSPGDNCITTVPKGFGDLYFDCRGELNETDSGGVLCLGCADGQLCAGAANTGGHTLASE